VLSPYCGLGQCAWTAVAAIHASPCRL
jgi:hypothetical protein